MWKLQQKSRGIRISKQKKEGGRGGTGLQYRSLADCLCSNLNTRKSRQTFPQRSSKKKRKQTPRTYTNKHHSSALLATTCERDGQQFTKALQHTFTFLIKLTPMILVTAYLSNNRNTQKNKIINRSTHKKTSKILTHYLHHTCIKLH